MLAVCLPSRECLPGRGIFKDIHMFLKFVVYNELIAGCVRNSF